VPEGLPRLYGELASWWPVFSAPADYAEEAGLYMRAIDALAPRPLRTLLELGSGGGNNASHMKARFALTLVDLSPGMLAVSRDLNPECEHVDGDMRTVRLGRTFDAVLIHDAIMYLVTEDDLRAAIATAAAHLAPGGVALFVPDDTSETYEPRTESGGHDDVDRAVRYLMWGHQPDGTTFRTTFVYVMRQGTGEPVVEWEDHVEGLFPRATWLRLIEEAGLEASAVPYDHSDFAAAREMFAGVAPAEG